MEKELKVKLARLEYESYLKDAVESAKVKFDMERPQYKGLVDSKSTHLIWEKRPKGYSKILPSVVKIMCSPDCIEKTQAKLTEEASQLHPSHKITKHIWSKNLQKYDKDNIKKKLKECDLPITLLKGCKTLAQVRKNMIIHHHITNQTLKSFKAHVSIDKNKVIIGKASFPVFCKKSKDKEYPCINVTVRSKRCSIRVDALAVALHQGMNG